MPNNIILNLLIHQLRSGFYDGLGGNSSAFCGDNAYALGFSKGAQIASMSKCKVYYWPERPFVW